MAKTKAKTTETTISVASFIKTFEDKQRQTDCLSIIEIMKKQSGFEPKMWGPGIIGFGTYHYKYESGHEGDAPLVGFSPRKAEFALYIANFDGKEDLLKKLEDIDPDILKKMVSGSIKHYQAKYK